MSTCQSCRWFATTEQECRRNAPRLGLVEFRDGQGPVKLTLWPTVDPNHSCGDHTPPKPKP
jgi:hypothetical protein